MTFELGFRKAKGPFRFDASVYYTKFDGFIFKQLTGVDVRRHARHVRAPPPDAELNQVLFQQRDATFYGAGSCRRSSTSRRIWRGVWGIDGQYDFVLRAASTMPRAATCRASRRIAPAPASTTATSNWLARLGFLHAFDQDRIGDNETPTKGYTLLNADLAYTFKLDTQGALVPEMTIGLKGENLLDDDVRNHVSFRKDEVLQPGRTIRLYGIVKLN